MRYLVIIPNQTPTYSQWFDAENHFEDGMTIFDLINDVYTTDGVNWQEIEFDHL